MIKKNHDKRDMPSKKKRGGASDEAEAEAEVGALAI